MTEHVTGTFTVAGWDENTFEEIEGGGKLTKAHVTFGLAGELKGEANWEAVMCYGQDGTAVFTGYQRVTGSLGSRKGTFVVRADGGFTDGVATTAWQVVDGSATGELAGLRGSGEAVTTGGSGGDFTLDYELG
ncbi:MAG TPA: DUF3224 domain-containing protein [Streptosporangiaceae bacterium]